MSNTISPTVSNALISLGITKWELAGGEPSDEAEFLSMFKKEMSNDNGLVVYSNEPSDFGVTWDQVKSKQDTLQSEYDAQEYARERALAYPSNGDQWDMIYKDMKNSTTTHADVVEAVKTKWPKDNSGPIE